MDQRNETFVPHVLAIVAGTTVDFPNNDQTYHNVFSLSKTKSFDLGRYAVGRSKSVRFDRPGIVRVFCDIHSHMSAFILVFAHRYFSVVDDDGRLPARERAAGHVHRRRLERVRAARIAASGRAGDRGRRRGELRARPAMNVVLVAHQPHLLRQRGAGGAGDRPSRCIRVNVAVTAQAENELRRGIEEAGTLLEEYRTTIFEHFSREARLVADLSNLKAAMTTKIRGPCSRSRTTTSGRSARDLFARHRPVGRGSRASGRLKTRRSRGSLREAIAMPTRGKETVSLWPHPGGVIQVVTVPSFVDTELVGTVSVGFSLDEETAAAVQGAHQQRDRVRRGPPGRGVDASGSIQPAARDARRHQGCARIRLGDSEYVAVSRVLAAAATADRRDVAQKGRSRRRSSCGRAPSVFASSTPCIASLRSRRSSRCWPRRC